MGSAIRDRVQRQAYDAIVVGSGPNGLAAAIELARADWSVLLLEAEDTIGGGARSAELTLPGFVHDICSAIHPLGVGSPFFRTLPLEEHGLEWIFPSSQAVHPLDDGRAVLLERSVTETARQFGPDANTYRRLMEPLVADWDKLAVDLLGPPGFPHHPLALVRFGLRGLHSACNLAEGLFDGPQARALFGGMAAHSMMPLEQVPTAAFGLVLSLLGHAVGWPMPRGGTQRIADALASYFRSLDGEIVSGARVESIDELPTARAILLDVAPRQLLQLAGHRFPLWYRNQLERYRAGPGAFKVDWALDGPIPWKAAEVARAGTVHLGGTFPEIAASERAVWRGAHAERPFVLVAQQSLFDSSRAPQGKHTAWAYCHVPNGSTFDMTERIEAQLERFAPGFRDLVLARSVMAPADLERHNANLIGGDINGGAMTLQQLLIRPALRPVPYTTPDPRLFLCSASTPPGGGVHGMCGYLAARAVLRRQA